MEKTTSPVFPVAGLGRMSASGSILQSLLQPQVLCILRGRRSGYQTPCAPRSKEPLFPTVPEPYGSPYVMSSICDGHSTEWIPYKVYENDKREEKVKEKKAHGSLPLNLTSKVVPVKTRHCQVANYLPLAVRDVKSTRRGQVIRQSYNPGQVLRLKEYEKSSILRWR